MKELSIEMKYIVHKMFRQRPKAFFGFNVLLPAYMAKAAMHLGITVQAVFFLTFGIVAHLKFFLKIGTKPALYRKHKQYSKSILYF